MKTPIRQAEAKDAPKVAPLLVQAMGDLACDFIGKTNTEEAIPLFESLFLNTENQYSYNNTLVFEEDGEVLGAITAYDGKHLTVYKEKFLQVIAQEYGVIDLALEDETQAGELYIDALSVSPKAQGKGVGTDLLKMMLQKAKKDGHTHVGLLVDMENPNAKRLYHRLGFIGSRVVHLGQSQFEHMQVLL